MQPRAYRRPTGRVDLAETHISLVFLTDDRVFKTKKPVRFPFLDYSTLEARRLACEDELAINRRLAPETYLGVVPITEGKNGLQVGGGGEVVDYAVEMVRLPSERMLDRLIELKQAGTSDIDRLLDLLVPFYASLPHDRSTAQFGEPELVRQAVVENVTTMRPIVAPIDQTLLARVRSSQWQYLTVAGSLFEQRAGEGRIVEGHGDLRPEHVCLLDHPVVFDGVEFSLPLRCSDVISELAFLAMECDFLREHSLGERLIEQYCARSNDSVPLEHAHFYKSYRATVRAKVELLRCQQQAGEEADAHRRRHHRYLHLAAAYGADFHRPIAILLVGVSGSGKSTLARYLSEQIGCEWLRTDAVRQKISGRRDPQAPMGGGMYASAVTDQTYEAIISQAAHWMREGVSVVLDGTFVAEPHRQAVRTMAARESWPLLVVRCHCSTELARQRVEQRRLAGTDISDARPELLDEQIRQLESSEEADATHDLRLDMVRPVEENMELVVRRLIELGKR
jgi:aminoglycoside phosphotransferase family enzyme/predicted kinase